MIPLSAVTEGPVAQVSLVALEAFAEATACSVAGVVAAPLPPSDCPGRPPTCVGRLWRGKAQRLDPGGRLTRIPTNLALRTQVRPSALEKRTLLTARSS